MPVRMEKEMHTQLRKLAFVNDVPMAELIRISIKNLLENNKKMLTL